jgi:hypothetical protein
VIDRIRRSAPVAFLVLLVTVIVACSEQVSGSLGCPELCTDQSALLKDTVLTASITIDTSLIGYPGIGETRDITMLNRGDTGITHFIARFDTLPQFFIPTTAQPDSSIALVDSASLIFFIDTLTQRPTAPITVEAYDVDTTGVIDSVRSSILPLFRPDRLIGTKTYQASEIRDTMQLPLDNVKIFAKIKDTLRLRIGLKVNGVPFARMRVLASQVLPRVRFRVSADTLVKPDTVFPSSSTPANDSFLAQSLTIYQVIAAGALPPPPPDRLAVGGLSGARTYFKFNIPRTVIDSVQVVRASLIVNQLPARSTARTSDTLTLFTHPILSSPTVTDVRTAIGFMGSPFSYGVDSVFFVAKDSGTKSFELVNLFRFWRTVGDSNATRAIVLTASQEGSVAGEIDFSSLSAAAALRPRLRITYVPRRGFGLP